MKNNLFSQRLPADVEFKLCRLLVLIRQRRARTITPLEDARLKEVMRTTVGRLIQSQSRWIAAIIRKIPKPAYIDEDDVLSDVLLEVTKVLLSNNASSYTPELSQLNTYLHPIVTRTARRSIADSQAAMLPVELTDAMPICDAEPSVSMQTVLDTLRTVCEQEVDMRDPLKLRIINRLLEGKSEADIARELGIGFMYTKNFIEVTRATMADVIEKQKIDFGGRVSQEVIQELLGKMRKVNDSNLHWKTINAPKRNA